MRQMQESRWTAWHPDAGELLSGYTDKKDAADLLSYRIAEEITGSVKQMHPLAVRSCVLGYLESDPEESREEDIRILSGKIPADLQRKLDAAAGEKEKEDNGNREDKENKKNKEYNKYNESKENTGDREDNKEREEVDACGGLPDVLKPSDRYAHLMSEFGFSSGSKGKPEDSLGSFWLEQMQRLPREETKELVSGLWQAACFLETYVQYFVYLWTRRHGMAEAWDEDAFFLYDADTLRGARSAMEEHRDLPWTSLAVMPPFGAAYCEGVHDREELLGLLLEQGLSFPDALSLTHLLRCGRKPDRMQEELLREALGEERLRSLCRVRYIPSQKSALMKMMQAEEL